MATDLRGVAVRDTVAALRGVAEALAPAERFEDLLTPLARVGDALRLGLEVPRPVRRFCEGLPRDALRGALTSLIEETASWNLPAEGAVAVDDPLLASVLRRRDEAASIELAVRRILLSKGDLPETHDELSALSTVLLTIDEAIGKLVTTSRATELLEVRAAMRPTWTEHFGDEPEAEVTSTEISLPRQALETFEPPDEDVTRYIVAGSLARYVEGVAAANADFAEELAASIDALLRAREDVSFLARRWRKGHGPKASVDPLSIAAVPAHRLAAASQLTLEAAGGNAAHLGVLAPLDAEARVVATANDLTFEVFPGTAPIARVEVGETVCNSPAATGEWRVVLPLPAGPVRVRVLGKDGREFAEHLSFVAAEPDDETQ